MFTARYALNPYNTQISVKTERDHWNTFRLRSSVPGKLETTPRSMYKNYVNQAARGGGRNFTQYHLKFRALLWVFAVIQKTLDSHAQLNHICISRTKQATCQHRRSDRGERSVNEILGVKSDPEMGWFILNVLVLQWVPFGKPFFSQKLQNIGKRVSIRNRLKTLLQNGMKFFLINSNQHLQILF